MRKDSPLLQFYYSKVEKYGPGGQTTDGCPPGYNKHPVLSTCIPNGWTPPANQQSGPTVSNVKSLNEKIANNHINKVVTQLRANGTYIEPNQGQQAQFNVYDEAKAAQGKRIYDEQMRQQAMANSELAQSFAGLTPSGSSDLGLIGANTFVNMNPITGPATSAGRLTQWGLGQNPYGFDINDGLSWGNTLGALGVLGDVAFAGSGLKPGINAINQEVANTPLIKISRDLSKIKKEGLAQGLSEYEISKNQLQNVGITSNQRKAYIPLVSDFLENYVVPYGYEGYGGDSKLTQTVKNIFGKDKSLSKYTSEGVLSDTRNPAREDAWSLYLGKPQKYNTFRMAETAPANHPSYSPGSLKNMDIYSVNYENELIPNVKSSTNPKIIDKKIDPLLNKVTIDREGNVMGGYNRRLSGSGLEYNDIWDLDPTVKIPFVDKKIKIPVSKVIGKPFMSHGNIPYTWGEHQTNLTNFLESKIGDRLAAQQELGIDFTPQVSRFLNQLEKVKTAVPIQKQGGVTQYKNGGGLLSRTVTCSNCGHSWKGVDGGMDPLTCHKCGGMIKMKQGGELTPEELASLNRAKMRSKMALSAEFGNPAARRMMNPTPPSYRFTGTEMFNGKPVVGFGEDQAKLGDTGTHRMGVMDNFAVPYIQQNPNGSLFYNQDPSPRDREAIRFDNPQDAQYFSEHYKEVAPMMKNYKKNGGDISIPEITTKMPALSLGGSIQMQPKESPLLDYYLQRTKGKRMIR